MPQTKNVQQQRIVTNSTDLIIGFAFSLMSDGAPGSYNEQLAIHLFKLLEEFQSAKGELPQVALQWEIADALEDLYPNFTDELTRLNKLLIVSPPEFLDDEIEETLFDELLFNDESKHSNTLQCCIDTVPGGSIIERLNSLLHDAKFYERFSGLELSHLVRPSLGNLFTEDRSLPRQSHYPLGLRRYQRMRVNRLIIESVVDNPKILKRGRYLSTSGVIGSVLDHCANHNLEIGSFNVVAHPLHAPRCIEQIAHALAERKLDVFVHAQMQKMDFPWDSSGAQAWCRSFSNWQQYEKVVQKLLGDSNKVE